MKNETKQLISIGLGYLGTLLFVKGNFISQIIALFIFVGLILLWRNNLIQWMKANYKLFINIRRRKYFFITEKGYKTDLKKRRELGSAVYSLTNVGFIVTILMLSFINKILGVQLAGLGSWIISGAIIIALLGMLFAIRNYWTGLYYYLLPLVTILFTIDYVQSYSNIKSIIIFIVVVLISYVLLTLSLPLHSLRKISSGTWIFGVLTTFLIPLLLEYFLKYYMMDTIQSELINQPITIESLENSNISMEIISFVKKNPATIELISRLRDMLVSYELNSISSELSVVRFLLLTSYSLGTIIITLKIKLGESKAKDIYKEVKMLKDVRYPCLRDCIFYGGEKYEDKIMGDKKFESIIINEENKYEKYVENTWWIKYPSIFIEVIKSMLKKMI